MNATEAPVSAATVTLLVQSINDPGTSIVRITDVVASDNGLAARVLALANSAAYGLARQITDIRQAVGLTGTNTVQTLAIAGSTPLLDGTGGLPDARSHALEVACAARALATWGGLHAADAFAAGLLHDLGEVLLWQRDPEGYAVEHAAWTDVQQQLRAERARYGADHALVAREQLAQWCLPGVIVDAVGDHHRPDLQYRDLSTVVVAAEELADPQVTWSQRFELFGLRPDLVDVARDRIAEQVAELHDLLGS